MAFGLVVDARPSADQMVTRRFTPIFGWRLFGRNAVDTYGTTPVTAKGLAMPYVPTDWLTAGASVQNLLGTEASTSSSAGAPGVAVITDQYLFFPAHGGLTLPAQTVACNITIGLLNDGGVYAANLRSVQVDIVKIASTGTVTQLATATAASLTNTTTSAAYVAQSIPVNVTLAATTLSSTERLALRINTKGDRSASGGVCYHCLNANSGSKSAPAAGATTSDVILQWG